MKPKSCPRPTTLAGYWLTPGTENNRMFSGADLMGFTLLLVFYLLYPHPGFDGIIPDNIAQTAYWQLLFRPELAGSVGSASPKGGLMVLFGVVHHLAYDLLNLPGLVKGVLAFAFAMMLFLIGRIARDLGGRLAGGLAVLVAAGSTYLPVTFVGGTSNLFFLPLVLFGLFALSHDRLRTAAVALAVAVTVRPEAILIMGLIIACHCLPQKRWRLGLEYVFWGTAGLAFYAALAYLSQGSWSRAGGGAGTGYPAFPSLRTVEHMRLTVGQFFQEPFVALLFLPAAFLAVRVRQARPFLYFYSMVIAFIILVAVDFFGMHYRYIAAGQALVFALGCAGLTLLYRNLRGVPPQPASDGNLANLSTLQRIVLVASTGLSLSVVIWATGQYAIGASLLVLPALYGLGYALTRISGRCRFLTGCHVLIVLYLIGANVAATTKARAAFAANINAVHPSILDAREFLNAAVIPAGAAVIAEDELLNYVLVKHPDRHPHLQSLQSFNLLADIDRVEALERAQFVYVSKRRNYGWNYMYYFPRADWVSDQFRVAMAVMIETNAPQRLLGSRFEPLYNSRTGFIARIVSGIGTPPSGAGNPPR